MPVSGDACMQHPVCHSLRKRPLATSVWTCEWSQSLPFTVRDQHAQGSDQSGGARWSEPLALPEGRILAT